MDSFDIKLLISIAFTLAYSIVYLVETSNADKGDKTKRIKVE